jgi:Flp pilus assembly protein CpaB
MTERARNIVIAVVLAGVAALLVGLYVSNYQRHVQRGEEHVTVWVATRDIPAGTTGADALSHGMISKTEVVHRAVVPGAISNTEQISGLVATQQIFDGEQITLRRFSQDATLGIQGELKGTQRAYQVQGDPNQLLAGTLRKGDHVDLVATFWYSFVGRGEGGGSVPKFGATRTVLRDLLVLRPPMSEVDTKVENGFGGDANVILRLTDAQAQKLDFTINTAVHQSNFEPRWHLTMRSPVKSADSPESITSLDSVLLDGLSAQQRARLNGKYQGAN